jgi:drug/metabolite transporter (DMT)-like permease
MIGKRMGRLIGVLLLVAGVVLALWGYNVSQSFSSQFNEIVSGSPSDKTLYLYAAGGICAVLGLLKILK